jgi:tRNA A-37 threonylcarbamoyl transferase component Bud32
VIFAAPSLVSSGAVRLSSSDDLSVEISQGTVIGGRYRLDRQVGQGGMGSVWAATHLVTRRSVAMKFIRGPADRPELRRRLLREARAASAVDHPNVVEIFDVFELDDQTPVLVMDLLAGETLGAKIRRQGQLELAETATLVLPAVSAVGAAHARGIVHRDLKPDNVLLAVSNEGELTVKVLDFGIAKLTSAAGEITEGLVTQTGSTLGTPCYMAPEQAASERDLDHRVDVWSLGVILYECLSGVRPIDGESVGQVVTRLLTTGIAPLERLVLGLPEDVTKLVGRMLSRERHLRPQSLHEVFDVLARYTEARPRSFGAPNSEPRSAEAASEPVARLTVQRVAEVADADPHAATVAQPLATDPSMARAAAAPAVRRRLAWLGALAALIAAASLGMWTARWLDREASSSAPPTAAATTSAATATANAPAATTTASVATAQNAAEPPIASSTPSVPTSRQPRLPPTASPSALGPAAAFDTGPPHAPAAATAAPESFDGGIVFTAPF